MTYPYLPGNGGGANPRGAASLLFGIIFAENCIKMKKKQECIPVGLGGGVSAQVTRM